MKLFAFTLFVVLFLQLSGQVEINDCENAVVVCSSDDLAFNPDGPGNNDFADPDNHPGCMVALEQNSAWYYFQIDPNAPPNLVLGFIIHPKGGLGEDYDWALFGPDVVCGDLGFPIRCSSSDANCGFCPNTGMGMGTTDVSEGPGTGDGFVMTLVVQPGQGFYLLIDNWQGTMNGFVLTWTDTAAPYLNCNAEAPCALEALAGADINTCEGDETPIPLDGESNGNHGNETYSWSGTNGGTAYLNNPNVEDPTVTIPVGFSGSITYTLTVVEDTCMSTDELEVIVNPLPVVTITPIGPFCDNNPPHTLSATPSGGTWGGAATGNTFNPMTNGPGIHTVTYTYSDANDCTTTASMDIEVFDSPDVSIDPVPAEFCDSENSILLTATGSGGAGNYTYAWNTPTGTGTGDTYAASAPGQYKVTVTDENNCTHSAVTTVVVHPNPDVQINDPGPICESVESMILTATPSGGTFNGSIVTSNGLLYPNMIAPGTYTVSYSFVDAFGCEGVDDQEITIVTTPDAMTDNNGPLCAGLPILLFGSTNGTGTITYLWTGPGGYTSNLQNPTNATLGGDYTLQVTIDGCPSPPSVTTVDLIDMPDAIAMNGGPYCNGQSIQLFGSTNSTGSNISYLWSGPNGYLSDLQNPTNAVDEGIYSLIVTAGGCVSTTAMTEVIFNVPPDAVATNMGPYCAGDTIQLFGNTNTPGSVINYTWNGPNGYTSTLQNPKGALAPGLYQLTVNIDGCNSPIDSTQVIINTSPQPVISGQATFCTGFSSVLNAGAGYAGYVWNDASTNQTLEVFSSGTYQVTVTDINGCTGTASFTATETASLAPVITGSLEFCEGSGTTLDAGAGFTSYTWSTGATSQTITVTTQGNFGVIVTDADGCSGSANITTTINLNPVVMIGGSTTYCIGGSTVLDAGAGYASYLWNNNLTSQTITVSSPGMYSVDVIDIHGCAGSGSTMVDESTSLHPVITGNDKFCENGSTTLNAGSGFATYLWSDGSTNQNLVVTSAGTYSVTVSDGQSCFGDSSITVSEVLPPSATLQPTATLCNTQAGGSIINLFDLILGGDNSGSWEDVDHSGAVGLFDNLDFANITAGNYHFEYTTNSAVTPCPESTYQVVVTVMDCACPDVFFLNAGPLCNDDDMLNLSTIANTLEPGTWSIIQTPPGTNPASLNGTIINTTGSDPGQYTFQYTLQNQPPPGCPVDFQVVVNVDANVDAGVAAAPLSYCFNDVDLVSLGSLISGEDANGTWTETSTIHSQGPAFNPANGTFNTGNQLSGTYTFNYALPSNGACLADATTVSVVINPLPTATIMDIGVLDCTHTTQSLDAIGSSFGIEYDITWSGPGIIPDGNEKTLHPNINKPGQYVLTVTNKQTGCFQTDSVDAIQNTNAPSDALITSQNPSCFGDQDASISIDQVIGGTPPYLFSINNALPGSNNILNNLSAGNYVIELIDAGGCRWDTMITIVAPTEFTVDLGPDIDLELGDSAAIQATVSLPSNLIDTLIWSPDGLIDCFDLACLEGTVHTFNNVTLTATVTDVNGCRNSDQITIRVKRTRKVFISTAFSPNEDGINDIFYIQGSDRQIMRIKKFVIYNRWGDLVHEALDFQPNDPSKGWNGLFKGEKMNPGVFVYRAEIEFRDGLTEFYTGDVTLMK